MDTRHLVKQTKLPKFLGLKNHVSAKENPAVQGAFHFEPAEGIVPLQISINVKLIDSSFSRSPSTYFVASHISSSMVYDANIQHPIL